MLRRLSPGFALVVGMVLAIAIAGTSTAGERLKKFGTGTVTFQSATSVTLNNGSGEYSGVYLVPRRSAVPVSQVHFSFDHSGSVAGGAPRFSIPIDTNRNGKPEGYAFIDALNCGHTNVGTVSTDSASCQVFFRSDVFPNWAALVTAHPSWRIPPGKAPFVIADQPGTYHISDIDLR